MVTGVLDATLMVLAARGRPSRTLLDRRLRGETVSVGRSDAGGRARAGRSGTSLGSSARASLGSTALVASDLLYVAGALLASRPFGERRGELAAILGPSRWCLAGRGFIGDGSTVAAALGALGFRCSPPAGSTRRSKLGPAAMRGTASRSSRLYIEIKKTLH